MIRTLLVTAAILVAAAPATASFVIDDFETDNGGVSALNYSGFADLAVTGKVDLVHSGDGSGVTCAGGAGGCVDLDGTSGPGQLSASLPGVPGLYAVLFSFDISGNQRGGAADEFYFGISANGVPLGGPTITLASDAPFQRYGLIVDFVRDPNLIWTAYVGTTSADSIGPILDNFEFAVSGGVCCPEPGQFALFGMGLAGVALRRRR